MSSRTAKNRTYLCFIKEYVGGCFLDVGFPVPHKMQLPLIPGSVAGGVMVLGVVVTMCPKKHLREKKKKAGRLSRKWGPVRSLRSPGGDCRACDDMLNASAFSYFFVVSSAVARS